MVTGFLDFMIPDPVMGVESTLRKNDFRKYLLGIELLWYIFGPVLMI